MESYARLAHEIVFAILGDFKTRYFKDEDTNHRKTLLLKTIKQPHIACEANGKAQWRPVAYSILSEVGLTCLEGQTPSSACRSSGIEPLEVSGQDAVLGSLYLRLTRTSGKKAKSEECFKL